MGKGTSSLGEGRKGPWPIVLNLPWLVVWPLLALLNMTQNLSPECSAFFLGLFFQQLHKVPSSISDWGGQSSREAPFWATLGHLFHFPKACGDTQDSNEYSLSHR